MQNLQIDSYKTPLRIGQNPVSIQNKGKVPKHALHLSWEKFNEKENDVTKIACPQ